MKIENANISFDSSYFLIEFSMFSRVSKIQDCPMKNLLYMFSLRIKKLG